MKCFCFKISSVIYYENVSNVLVLIKSTGECKRRTFIENNTTVSKRRRLERKLFFLIAVLVLRKSPSQRKIPCRHGTCAATFTVTSESPRSPRAHTIDAGAPLPPQKIERARERNPRKSFEVAFQRGSLLAVSPRRVTFAERE